MTFTYFGHSAFQIQTNGTTILTDPFIDGNKHAEGIVNADSLDPDVVLLTHAHGDHYGNTPGILERTGAQVVANYEIIQYIAGELDHDAGHPMNTGGSWDFDWGSLTMTYARHSSSFPDGTYGGNPNGFIMELEGKTIYNTGDTCYFAELKWYADRYDIDLLLLPIGDDFTMGPDEAVAVAEILQPILTVPVHYDTFPYIEVDTDDWADMMAEADLDAKVVAPGEELTV
jgi:L-ascorbate metabolism protein UlaG (beta-lactamase superfamily)